MLKTKTLGIGMFVVLLSMNTFAQVTPADAAKVTESTKELRLEPAERGGGRPLMEVFNERQSIRQISEQELEPRILSQLIWATNGVNREGEGKRTAPSAKNAQEIDIYIVTREGIYLYIPEGHTTKAIKSGDFRKMAVGRNEFAAEAPVVLVFVANAKKMEVFDATTKDFYSGIDCGYISQNVYMYCASENLATVALGGIDKDALGKILGLKNDKVLLSQPVGYRR
jgi:SagB-type dehydrogenase family enzyme